MHKPSDLCIQEFEKQYDAGWDDPSLRNERIAWVNSWEAALATVQPADHIADAGKMVPAQPLTSSTGTVTALRAARHDLGQLAEDIEQLVRSRCTHTAEAVGVLEIVKHGLIAEHSE